MSSEKLIPPYRAYEIYTRIDNSHYFVLLYVPSHCTSFASATVSKPQASGNWALQR